MAHPSGRRGESAPRSRASSRNGTERRVCSSATEVSLCHLQPSEGSLDALVHVLFFVDLAVADTSESAGESFADVVHEVMVRESGVPQANREHDEIGEKVGSAESVRVDIHGAENARMGDAGEEGRVQGDHLIVEGADRRDLDARMKDDPQAATL